MSSQVRCLIVLLAVGVSVFVGAPAFSWDPPTLDRDAATDQVVRPNRGVMPQAARPVVVAEAPKPGANTAGSPAGESLAVGDEVDTDPIGPASPALPPLPRGLSLTTTFAGGNECATGDRSAEGLYFDIVVGANPIAITALDVNSDMTAGCTYGVDVFIFPFSFVGNENALPGPGSWTRMASGIATGSDGNGQAPDPVVLDRPINLPPGTWGMCVILEAPDQNYTSNAPVLSFSDANITINTGSSVCQAFITAVNTPRTWNGTVYYNLLTPAAAGACCLNNVCFDIGQFTIDTCVPNGGLWLGDGSTCTVPNGPCDPVPPLECCAAGPVSAFPITDDFEDLTAGVICGEGLAQRETYLSDTSHWKNVVGGDDFIMHWQSDQLTTPSAGTGPSSGANGSVRFIYIESSPDHIVPHVANIQSECMDFTLANLPQGDAWLTFYYHMFGANMGRMRVETSIDGCATWQPTSFDLTGDQGDAWRPAFVDLNHLVDETNVIIRFRAERPAALNSFTSDFALDDIGINDTVVFGACCDDLTSTCTDDTAELVCVGTTARFTANTMCGALNPVCGNAVGACCQAENMCTEVGGIDCAAVSGIWSPGLCSNPALVCNDQCETPITLTSNVAMAFDSTNAITTGPTTQGIALQCQDVNANPQVLIGRKDLWFRFVAIDTTPIVVTTCGSSYDTTLQVYRDFVSTNPVDCSMLDNGLVTEEFCNDDGCAGGDLSSELVINTSLVVGQEYLIRVGGFGEASSGPGTIQVAQLAVGIGACCAVDGSCAETDEGACIASGGGFSAGQPCGAFTACGELGACCSINEGCTENSQTACGAINGTFLGAGSDCSGNGGIGLGTNCDGSGLNDFCTLTLGLERDCDNNGNPDNCDITANPNLDCSDGMGGPPNGKIDHCEIRCCEGDTDLSGALDGRDIELWVAGVITPPGPCFDDVSCALDTNNDGGIDIGDVPSFVDKLLDGSCLGVLVFYASESLPAGAGTMNMVHQFDQTGALLSSFGQVPTAAVAPWGYRDMATDGNFIYGGWSAGLARHDLDGLGGILQVNAPAPDGVGTWRALAFDADGNGGAGSFWTANFGSNLIEVAMDGTLLNSFPAGVLGADTWALYGLAIDSRNGRLWGHTQTGADDDEVWEIEKVGANAGVPTGVIFQSLSGDPDALAGGFSEDPGVPGVFFDMCQCSLADTVSEVLINLGGPPTIQLNPNSTLSPNPLQVGNIWPGGGGGGLGVVATRQ